MTEKDDGPVWIELSVDMPSCAGSEVEDYVAVPRAEWDAMTEEEREARVQQEIEEFLANSVNAGGGVVDESKVPLSYRKDVTS